MQAKKPFSNNLKKYSHIEDDIVLFRKFLKSLLGIFIVVAVTLLTLQYFGPKIFSVFGLLSLDRFDKVEVKKPKTLPPSFADTPEATKNQSLDIVGFSEPGSTVRIFVNGPEAGSTIADSEGKFSFTGLELIEGQNIIFAKAEAQNEEESDKSETVYVNLDNKEPEIRINKPKHKEEIESIDSRVSVEGSVNEESTVSVNSHITVLDSEGNFKTLIQLKEGGNIIKVIATDKAGNEATESIEVEFKKR